MTTATVSRPRLAALLPLGLPLVALLWAFWPTLVELVQTWQTNPQYSHGFLVPFFAAFLLWLRRDRLAVAELRPSWWGLLLLGGGILIRLFATYKYFVALEPLALLPCVAGLFLLLGGRAAWRWAWPAVLFLIFMIPLPYSLATAMAGPLQRLATITCTFVMQTLGMPALAEGNVILLNEHHIGIVEACSGLRMLVVFFALSTAVVLVAQKHWIDRLVIFASAIPIALFSNIIRVTATGIMYELGYSELANHFFHDVAGYIMMPLALGMLWMELKLMSFLIVELPAPIPAHRPSTTARRPATGAPRPAVPRSRRSPATREAKREAPVQPRRTPVAAEPGTKKS